MLRPFLFLIGLIFIGCTSSKSKVEKRCEGIVKNDFKQVTIRPYEIRLNDQTDYINELRFECVYTAFYIQKHLYDNFGRWDKEIYIKNNPHPMLLWENIPLIGNEKTTYNVVAMGKESSNVTYASVLVFNNTFYDFLSESSPIREKLITYFSDAILFNDLSKTDFYKAYWLTVDAKHWEWIQQQKKLKQQRG